MSSKTAKLNCNLAAFSVQAIYRRSLPIPDLYNVTIYQSGLPRQNSHVLLRDSSWLHHSVYKASIIILLRWPSYGSHCAYALSTSPLLPPQVFKAVRVLCVTLSKSCATSPSSSNDQRSRSILTPVTVSCIVVDPFSGPRRLLQRHRLRHRAKLLESPAVTDVSTVSVHAILR